MKKKKLLIIIIIFFLVLLLGVTVLLLPQKEDKDSLTHMNLENTPTILDLENVQTTSDSMNTQTPSDSENAQADIDLGNSYLEEMKYDEALTIYKDIIASESNHADAYLGIVEVYIRTGELETALEYAEQGYNTTDDESLKETVEMLRSKDIIASNGWVIRRSHYDENGIFQWWQEYDYNEQGQTSCLTTYNSEDIEIDRFEYLYNENGQCVQTCDSDNITGMLSRKDVIFESENIIQETCFEEDDTTLRCIISYKYDSEGRKTERIVEYPSGKVTHQGYEYNEQGLESRLIYYSWETGEITQYWQHNYDDKGNKVSAELYHFPDEFVARSIYEYDENNHLTKETRYDASGNLVYEKTYE